jgi:hypothetical protein
MRPRSTIISMSLAAIAACLLVFAFTWPSFAEAATDAASWADAPPTAPASPPPRVEDSGGYDDWSTKLRVFASTEVVQTAARVVLAVLLFIGGWIVAKLVAYGAFQALSRTKLDNVLAEKLGISMILRERRDGEGEEGSAVERLFARIVFWIVMLLVIVGVLEFAGLQQVAGPIQRLVDTVAQALPRVGKAALILLVAYIAGRVLSLFVSGALDRLGVDRRFAQLTEDDAAARGARPATTQPFSSTTGRVVFWLLMFFGLAGAFEALEIQPIAEPLRNAIDHIVSLLPRIAVASLLVLAGWIIGRILRTVVRNLLQSIGFDALAAKLGVDKLTGKLSPADLVASVLFVFVMFQASIAALNELGLETLSIPLTGMMTRFWGLVPAIGASLLIVLVGVVVGRLLRRVVAAALKNVGFDGLMSRLGFDKLPDRPDHLDEYSEIVALAVYVGVILLAVAQALANLQLHTWAGYVDAFLAYMVKNVAVAMLVVLVGFGIGNYVRDIIRSRRVEVAAEVDDGSRGWLAEFARYAVLVFACTMAVRQLDVAEDFVLITFGLLFGALCLAAALAFGLGGREVAGDIVKRRYDAARAKLSKPLLGPRTPPAP